MTVTEYLQAKSSLETRYNAMSEFERMLLQNELIEQHMEDQLDEALLWIADRFKEMIETAIAVRIAQSKAKHPGHTRIEIEG